MAKTSLKKKYQLEDFVSVSEHQPTGNFYGLLKSDADRLMKSHGEDFFRQAVHVVDEFINSLPPEIRIMGLLERKGNVIRKVKDFLMEEAKDTGVLVALTEEEYSELKRQAEADPGYSTGDFPGESTGEDHGDCASCVNSDVCPLPFNTVRFPPGDK